MNFKLLPILLIFSICSCNSNSNNVDRIGISIGSNLLNVEVAATHEARATGLMHRESMDDDSGMIFIFDKEQSVSFWMKNTLIPLSIAYIGKDGLIQDIYDMKPLSLEGVPSKRSSVLYALEVNVGYFDKHSIKAGDLVDLSSIKVYLNSSK